MTALICQLCERTFEEIPDGSILLRDRFGLALWQFPDKLCHQFRKKPWHGRRGFKPPEPTPEPKPDPPKPYIRMPDNTAALVETLQAVLDECPPLGEEIQQIEPEVYEPEREEVRPERATFKDLFRGDKQ